MKRIFTLLISLLPLLAGAQSTTTFWENGCEDLSEWTGDWVLENYSHGDTYSLTTESWADYSTYTSYELISKSFDISNYSQCKLTFYLELRTDDGNDGMYIEVSDDDGTTWTKLYNSSLSYPYDGKLPSGNILGTNLAWYNDITSWKKIVVDLSEFEGATNFKFKLTFGSDSDATSDDYGPSVDDFAIYGYAKTTIHNHSTSTDQIVFDNSYLYVDDPTFCLSSDIATTFDRFKVELNKSPQFSDISYVQEFNKSYNGDANYTKGTEYDLTCDQLNPPLTFEDNTTYYVRAAASTDAGSSWGKWSNIISFTYKTTTSSEPQWHQVVDWQFKTNDLEGIEVNNDAVDYKSTVAVSKSIANSADDMYEDDANIYTETPDFWIGEDYDFFYAGLRFTNLNIPASATITKSFIVVNCHYISSPTSAVDNAVDVNIFGDDVGNSDVFTVSDYPSIRTTTTSIVNWTNLNDWYNYLYYQTPDVSPIVQEIVDRGDWANGNALSFIIEDDGSSTDSYRKIRTIDSDPSYAPQLYVEYENTENGIITSSPIYLASFENAGGNWGTLFWEEEGANGDFTVTVQEYSGGTWSDIGASYTDLNYSSTGHDLSGLSNSIIRLVGTFTPASGETPTLKDWTVTTESLAAGNAELTLSLNANDLTPCEKNEVTYTLSVANNGPDEATGIVIDYAIPAGLTLESASSDKGVYDQTAETWTIGALQNGETAVFTLVTQVNGTAGGSTITSTASVNSLMQTGSNPSVSLDIDVIDNRAPVIADIADQQTSFNTAFSTITYDVTDDDSNEDDLSYTASASDTELIPNTEFSYGGTGTSRELDILPGTNQYGTTEVTITVDDGLCTSTRSFGAEVLRHQYTNMEEATLVIGQTDFTSTTSTVDATHTPGASSCMVSPLGQLAVGSQHTSGSLNNDGRVMFWENLPTANGEPADYVLGKEFTTSTASGTTDKLTKAVDGVAFSADGNKLLVSDAGNNRVLIWNTIPTSTFEAADVVIGQPNMTTGTSGCSSTKMNTPKSLVVTPDGKLFVADNDNNRVLVYNSIPTENEAAADIVIGQDDFNTNTSGNAANKMNDPWDITISTDGKLLVSDVDNNRILVFNSIPEQNGASADYVIGQEDFGISSSGLGPNKFNEPVGVTVSPSGLLAVGEFSNHRVVIFNEVPQENGASADIVLGQPNFYTNAEFSTDAGLDGTPNAKNFENPYTIYFDINDRLFVNGRDMNRVMVFGDLPAEESDLQISIISDTDAPCMGNPVSYTVDITNNGADDATNLVANAALPSGFYYYDHEAQSGTYDPAGGNWQIPSLANGSTVSLTITGTVDYSMGGKDIEAYASVRSNNQKETNYTNNTASKSITITDNSSPFVSRISDQQNNVGTIAGPINFTVRDEDGTIADEDVTATSSNQSVVQNANITIGGTGESRSISLDPESGIHGLTTITLTVQDNSGCQTTETFTASFGNLWIGKTTDWHTEANWGGEVPKSGVDVYIPASPAGGNFPLISNNVAMRDIYLEEGAQMNANNPVTITIERDIYNDGAITINNGTIIISGADATSGTSVSVSGTGTLQMHDATLSGDISCSSNLGISGNWNRTGTFTHSAGIVTFNGSAAQTVSSAESFYSLGVDNASGVTFADNINVADTLKLTSGTITASGLFVLANGATIERTVGNLADAPTFGATTNIVYKGTVTAGNEIPGTNNVGDLRINGSGIEVTLPFTINVNNELEFVEGIISTGANSLVMVNTTAADLIGGSETSFVNGTLERYIASNADTYIFPIGNGTATTNYLPIEFVNNNLTGTNILTASVDAITESGDNVDANLNTTESGGNNYVNVVENAVWEIIPDAPRTGGDYGVRLYFNSDMAAAVTDNEFGILKRPSGSTTYSDWNSYGGSTTIPAVDAVGRTVSGGYAERLGYTSFSEFAIASSEFPLPVSLKSFTGKWAKEAISLTWQTTSEYKNDYFIIEKSEDGINYSEFARVEGAGNSSTLQTYTLTDDNIRNHIYYYRLKQVDFDGTLSPEGVVAVQCPVIDAEVNVYPQPANNQLNIRLKAYQENSVDIKITNSLGKPVMQQSYEVFKGTQIIDIKCNDLSKGWYILQISDGNVIHKQPIIIH